MSQGVSTRARELFPRPSFLFLLSTFLTPPYSLFFFLLHLLATKNNEMAVDERLTCTSSSMSSSDDGLASFSTRPTTPEWSPQFSSYREEPLIESQFSGLSTGHSNDLSHVRAYQALPDPTDARTATGQAVKNICYIGAGYVGMRLHSSRPRLSADFRRRPKCCGDCSQ